MDTLATAQSKDKDERDSGSNGILNLLDIVTKEPDETANEEAQAASRLGLDLHAQMVLCLLSQEFCVLLLATDYLLHMHPD